jgi:hypothetical protein
VNDIQIRKEIIMYEINMIEERLSEIAFWCQVVKCGIRVYAAAAAQALESRQRNVMGDA